MGCIVFTVDPTELGGVKKGVPTGQRVHLKGAILPSLSTSACTAVEAVRAIIAHLPLLT